jgi:ATP phosphoribosyltransferase regulatory subunit
MSRTDRWLLPEGIEELLPVEASRLEALRRRLLDLYATWGYAQVMPPFIEYLESLLVGSGSDLDLETFKLTDQLTGRLMGVRADMTQQVARIDAHRLQHEAPTRLCYLGTVLRARPDGPGGSRSPLQVGAELYGHAGIESDAEVVALMIETLEACGIRDVHLDLGHVGIFRGLTAAAGLDELREAELFEMLQRKARAELEAAVAGMPQEHASRLLALVDLNGGDEVLDAARERLAGATAEVDAALASLAGVAEVLRRERPELVLHFDLAELRGYRYHTGVVLMSVVFSAVRGRPPASAPTCARCCVSPMGRRQRRSSPVSLRRRMRTRRCAPPFASCAKGGSGSSVRCLARWAGPPRWTAIANWSETMTDGRFAP